MKGDSQMKVVVIILVVALVGFAVYEGIMLFNDARKAVKKRKAKKQQEVKDVSTETTKDEVDRKE